MEWKFMTPEEKAGLLEYIDKSLCEKCRGEHNFEDDDSLCGRCDILGIIDAVNEL